MRFIFLCECNLVGHKATFGSLLNGESLVMSPNNDLELQVAFVQLLGKKNGL